MGYFRQKAVEAHRLMPDSHDWVVNWLGDSYFPGPDGCVGIKGSDRGAPDQLAKYGDWIVVYPFGYHVFKDVEFSLLFQEIGT